MEFSVKTARPENQKTACLVLGIFEDETTNETIEKINSLSNNLITNLLESRDITGKKGEKLLIPNTTNLLCKRLLIVGCGKKEKFAEKEIIKFFDTTAAATPKKLEDITIQLVTTDEESDQTDFYCEQLGKGTQILANQPYSFNQLKTDVKEEDQPKLSKVTFLVPQKSGLAKFKDAVAIGQAIANGQTIAKDLANLPGNHCTPSDLAEKAKKIVKKLAKTSIEILDEKDMEKLKMGSLLSVSKGSEEEARLIAIKYSGAKKTVAPIVLVGKGLTFDAGGISLKPAAAMDEMKYDMCGGASVIGTIAACAELQLPINVIAVVPSSENLPDGKANKPGDIVTSMAGKTIEILNTDAEGRLILCDALTYSAKYKPQLIIDIATLTGACIVALGAYRHGVMGNDKELVDSILSAGEKADDRGWELPLDEEYADLLKSNFADLANVGGRDAGTITAGCFLSEFTKEQKWAHIDIAGTAWKSGKAKGATGRPVPLLVQLLCDLAAKNENVPETKKTKAEEEK
ncbi:MAG: leucyl aminopeptidase [Gammaproteobacteria bacterium]|nr:MAG: leucyl aminopeptidase [Gammaproteobacteria bacterium]